MMMRLLILVLVCVSVGDADELDDIQAAGRDLSASLAAFSAALSDYAEADAAETRAILHALNVSAQIHARSRRDDDVFGVFCVIVILVLPGLLITTIGASLGGVMSTFS